MNNFGQFIGKREIKAKTISHFVGWVQVAMLVWTILLRG